MAQLIAVTVAARLPGDAECLHQDRRAEDLDRPVEDLPQRDAAEVGPDLPVREQLPDLAGVHGGPAGSTVDISSSVLMTWARSWGERSAMKGVITIETRAARSSR